MRCGMAAHLWTHLTRCWQRVSDQKYPVKGAGAIFGTVRPRNYAA